MLQALREALRQCRCADVHVCVHVFACACLFEGGGGGGEEEQDGSLILLSRFQVRRGEDPGAAAAPWWRWSAVRD